jgi:hypothetical protein
MTATRLILLIIFLSTVPTFAFTQSRALPKCGDPIRSVVWQEVRKIDSFSSKWNCNDRLGLDSFRFGNSKGFIVRTLGTPLCGATGNCPTWVVATVGRRYRIVLNAGSVIKTVNIDYRRADRFPTLSFRGKIGASDHYLGKFRFDGNRYRLVSCVYETYTTDGKRHLTKASMEYCRR